MHTFIKILTLEIVLHNNYLTILIILILLKDCLLKLYTKSTILIFDL